MLRKFSFLWRYVEKRRRRATATPTVLQRQVSECGVAALAIMLRYYGCYASLEELRRVTGVSRNGLNLADLRDAAEHYGLTVSIFKKSLAALPQMSLPCIVHTRFIHFMVLEEIRDGRVYVNDPGCGAHDIELEEFDEIFTGLVMTCQPGPAFRPTPPPPHPLKRVMQALKPVNTPLLLAMAGYLAAAGCLAVVAVNAGRFIDLSMPAGAGADALPIVLLSTGLVILGAGCLGLAKRALLRVSRYFSLTRLEQVFERLLTLPGSFFNYRYPGVISADIHAGPAIAEELVKKLSHPLLQTLAAPLLLVVLWGYAPLLGLLGCGGAAVCLGMIWRTYGSRRSVWRRVRHAGDEARGFSSGQLYNMPSLRVGGREWEALAGITGMQAKSLTVAQEFGAFQIPAAILPGVLAAASLVIGLIWGSLTLATGTRTLGEIATALLLLFGVLTPFAGLLRQGASFQLLLELIDKLEETLTLKEGNSQRGERPSSAACDAALILRDVTFGYAPHEAPLLEQVSFRIEAGQQTGVGGAPGSGKTTLARIIGGLCEPWQGDVVFSEGKPTTGPSQEIGLLRSPGNPSPTLPEGEGVSPLLRRGAGGEVLERNSPASQERIGLVETFPVFFEGTVKDNITLWHDQYTDEQVKTVLREAEVWEEIEARGGVGAEVKRSAENFSGGQKRRLALARALLSDPALLILDETFDGLELPLEQRIRSHLRRRGCTLLIISSRQTTLDACDVVFHLKHKQVFPGKEPFQARQENACAGDDVVLPIKNLVIPPGRDALREAARAHGLFLRKVRLREQGWQQREHGPLIGFLKNGHQPVALLQESERSYQMLDPLSETSVRVDAAVAARLETDAYMPYRFAQRPTTALWRILAQGFGSAAQDAGMALLAGVSDITLWFAAAMLGWFALAGSGFSGEDLQPGWLILWGALLTAGITGCTLTWRTSLVRLKGKVSLNVNTLIWSRLLRLPVWFFTRGSVAEIAGWGEGAKSLIRTSGDLPPAIAAGTAAWLLALAGMNRFDPHLAQQGSLLLLMGVIIPLLLTRGEMVAEEQRFTRRADNREFLSALIRAFLAFRLAGAIQRLTALWQNRYAQEARLRTRQECWRHAAQVFSWFHPLFSLTVLMLAAHTRLHPLTFVGCCLLFAIALPPLRRMSDALAASLRETPAARRVRPLLRTPLESRPEHRNIGAPGGRVSVRNLSFAYPHSTHPVLQQVSFEFEPGQIVGIAGASGSGKSTLLQLLAGFERPASGGILYDGQPLDDINAEELRRWIGAVFQDEFLSTATVRAHIAGMSPYPLSEVWEAARLAALDGDIKGMPMEMQTLVDSVKLSTGQAQRIQIARALLRRPRLLFLDEAVSGLDTAAQQRLFRTFRALDLTCLIVSHRPETLTLTDRIIVFERGRIVRQGPYL